MQNKLVKPPPLERASSEDSGLRKRNEAMALIDWANSKIYRDLHFNVQDKSRSGIGLTGTTPGEGAEDGDNKS